VGGQISAALAKVESWAESAIDARRKWKNMMEEEGVLRVS
jgi:hypothetical protein